MKGRIDIDRLKNESSKIRELLIETISKTGGHLAPNLGVVELTQALHEVFQSPKDKILFDVGHQSYVHKLLTGRKENFSSLRQKNGIGPFMDPRESEHDPFITGHAGSALSAGAGIAMANPESKVVVVIGDASISNGHSMEALNNIGGKIKNLVVILNDNEMSIGKNVGSLSRFFGKLIASDLYLNMRNDIKGVMNKGKIGKKVNRVLERMEVSVKQFFLPLSISEALGFTFLGVVDGHNLDELVEVLEKAKTLEGPIFIHVKTQKGKGYHFAEENKEKFHGIAPFDVATGSVKSSGKSFSKVFGDTMVEFGKEDKDVYCISAGMIKGTGLGEFQEAFPERCIDVGISEGHGVSFAGGLGISGKKPYVAIYSTFLQRAYGQLIHDISIQKLPVKFIVDRAGIVGEDGKTHQGIYDIGMFLQIPNFAVVAPSSAQELEEVLKFSKEYKKGPIAIRFPRGSAYEIPGTENFQLGKWKTIREKNKNLYIGTGSMLKEILSVEEELKRRGLEGTIIGASTIKPLDEEFILSQFKKYENIFILEEGYRYGGFGNSILDYINRENIDCKINIIALDTGYIPHGTRDELLREYGLRGEKLVDRIEGSINANKK
ncbi:1-deoxy-D-xylulose-5-phosphate synthase [Cetobacterium ceti]|uniref:1-deoxy-D-xylulose-5-phosphate synthase n=1 Tax=Cetobacterium ceti TaxID=180163 RepID=A0A1T4NZH5_9FUSO|nr:1-deoxy-D-xylulose-5-phosphate synthase [Cetobacterium ceti]SJZ84108.1 1-deoxy-D-xylulose-5-phosphate synthase [Cetobacterium ceti]